MLINTFLLCVVCWGMVPVCAGQKIELQPFSLSGATKPCQDGGTVVEGDWVEWTVVLNATGTNRREWPLNKIILQETITVSLGYLASNITDVCEINIEQDGCTVPNTLKCGYCQTKDGEVYRLIFTVTATRLPVVDSSKQFSCLWVGKSQSKSSTLLDSPRVLAKKPLIEFQKLYFGSSVLGENDTVNTRSEPLTACVGEGGDNLTVTWNLQSYHIKERCLNESDLVQLMTSAQDNDVTASVQDVVCQRKMNISSPMFLDSIREPECQLQTPNDNESSSTWTCRLPSYGACVSFMYCQMTTYIYDDILDTQEYFPFNLTSDDVTPNPTYTCEITTDLIGLQSSFKVELSYLFKFGISETNECVQDTGVVSFTANELKEIVVNPGENVTFVCQIYGYPMPKAQLLGPELGSLKLYQVKGYRLNHTLESMQCNDSGRYVCKADRGLGSTNAARQKFVDVNIVCPPDIITPAGQMLRFISLSVEETEVTFEIYGYPAPYEFLLKREQNSVLSQMDEDEYSIKVERLIPPFYRLTLTFHNATFQIPAIFVLHVSNGVGDGLDITFEIIYPGTPLAWPLIVGIYAGAIVVFTIFAFIVCCLRKRSQRRESDDEENINDNGNNNRSNTGQEIAVVNPSYETSGPAGSVHDSGTGNNTSTSSSALASLPRRTTDDDNDDESVIYDEPEPSRLSSNGCYDEIHDFF